MNQDSTTQINFNFSFILFSDTMYRSQSPAKKVIEENCSMTAAKEENWDEDDNPGLSQGVFRATL